MPVRGNAEAAQTPETTPQGVAQPIQAAQAAQPAVEGDDAWDLLDKHTGAARGGQDEGGFDRMNTNFYLKEGEEAKVVFLSESPFIFTGHSMERISQAGRKWYETVPCQKSAQGHCCYCQAGYAGRQFAGFAILDGRGAYDKNQKKCVGGDPVPMIFLMSLGLAKVARGKRDELGGKFDNIVFNLKRVNKNYDLAAKMENKGGGLMQVVRMNGAYQGKVPNVAVVFAPDTDDQAQHIISSSSPASARQPLASGTGAGQRPNNVNPATAPAQNFGNGGGLF